MDVILIQPKNRLSRAPTSRKQSVPLPLGLLTIASTVHAAGFSVVILDQRTDPDWEQLLKAHLSNAPLCVGITVSTGPQIWWALGISKLVKQISNVPVVWGGVHGSLLPEQTLSNPFIDFVVMEEGEETFIELLTTLKSQKTLDQVKGICYKEHNIIKRNEPRASLDLNRQPLLNYHLIDINKYASRIRGNGCLPFETSRGCPHRCAFCYNTCIQRRTWRSLSVEQTLIRIEHAVKNTGIHGLSFSDDNFFFDLNRAYGILKGLVDNRNDLVWGKGDIRLDDLAKLDDDYFDLIQKSGCLNLVIGIESGSQRVADLLRKDIDVSRAVDLNRKMARYNFFVHYLFLVGTPGETLEDLAQTGRLILQLIKENPKADVGTQKFVPYPGTELFDIAVEQGISVPRNLEDWSTYTWMNRRLTYPWLTSETQKAIQMLTFCAYFLTRERNFSRFNSLIRSVNRIYKPIAEQRIKAMHYRFFPELKIAEILGYRGY